MSNKTYTVTVSDAGAEYLESAAKAFACPPELVQLRDGMGA